MAQVLVPHATYPPNDPATGELPRLADGVELLGRYESSGFQEVPYLVRRPDGQVIQVSELIYLVAAGVHDSGDPHEVAARVSAEYGREVSADNVAYLIEKKLRPAGLLQSSSDAEKGSAAPNPMLALRLRLPLIPEHVHRIATKTLTPLFWPPIIAVALVALLVFDAWLLLELGNGVIFAAQSVIYTPQLFLPITLLTVVMGGFHEMGHAAAARYGGATPGAMGAGIYLVWPVFYTDVTDSYRLDRRGRLRTDLGGIYFNVLFIVAIGAVYLATGQALFLVFILLAHIETLRQFLPFVRLDGFYILSDLAGVPNLFSFMGPALARATRLLGRGSERHAARGRALDALTRRARILLVTWACVTAPILAVNIGMISIFLPRFAGAAWGSAGLQLDALRQAVGSFDLAGAATAGFGLVFLVLPVAGMVYIASLIFRRIAPKVRTWWQTYPTVTGTLTSIVGVAMVLQVSLVWPSTFTNAASEPGRREAEAAAAETGAAARAALGRGMRAAASVIGMGPTAGIPEAEPASPTPALRATPLPDDTAAPDVDQGQPFAADAPDPLGPGEVPPADAGTPRPPRSDATADQRTRRPSGSSGQSTTTTTAAGGEPGASTPEGSPSEDDDAADDNLLTSVRGLVGGLLGGQE